MAIWKCTAFIKASSLNRRSGSWSENYYVNASSSAAAEANFRTLMAFRIGMASIGTSIKGFKFTNLEQPGQSRPVNDLTQFNGAFGAADTPWQTLLITGYTATGNKRVLKFPAVPDGQIVEGAFQPSPFYTAVVNQLRNSLVNGGWGLFGYDFANPRVDVLGVDTTGAFVFSDAVGGGPGSPIKFFRTRTTDKRVVRGIWRIGTLPTPTTGTIRNWPSDFTVNKGKVNLFTRSLKLFTDTTIDGISKRNLGKDFFQFVGRRKKGA